MSDAIAIKTGESAQLICVGYPADHVNITWSYNNQSISEANGITVREEILPNGKKSILEYSSMNLQDAGPRKCTVSNGCQSVTSDVSVAITGEISNFNCWKQIDSYIFIEDIILVFHVSQIFDMLVEHLLRYQYQQYNLP